MMGSMDEVDTAYLSQRIAQLESNQQLQSDLYLIERTSGKRCFALCGIFQVLWLLACTTFIAIIFSVKIPGIRKELAPVGTVMAWLPAGHLPEGVL